MLSSVNYEAYMNPSYLRRIAKIYGIEDELAKLQSGEVDAIDWIDWNGRKVWLGVDLSRCDDNS